jgi:predicted MFS family arabinose efflux permease
MPTITGALVPRLPHSWSLSRRLYALGLLVVVGTCSWTDRQLFSILLQPIKNEFGLSDTQLGLVGGTAFGLFYVSVGLPVAWLADRGNRRTIIAVSTALWSLMTALTGTASGYASLFLCRMGVGIGEAGSAAPSQSLVSDYFGVRHRALAMGVLYSYLPIGYLLSYWLGGVLSDAVGWRNAFILFGIPGLVLAVLVRTTLLEPRCSDIAPRVESTPPLASAIRYFLRHRSLRHLPLAGTAHGIGMFGAAVWMPAYLMRAYHLSAGAVGVRLALVMGVAGLIGTIGGGQLVDKLVARTQDTRWYGYACCVFLLVALPFTICVFCLASDANTAMLLYAIPMILNHMILGPVVATVQNLAGARRRAMAAAFYLFLVNLISSTVGPFFIGAVSDLLGSYAGGNSLRYSLTLLMSTTSMWAVAHFYLAGRAIPADIKELNSSTAAVSS